MEYEKKIGDVLDIDIVKHSSEQIEASPAVDHVTSVITDDKLETDFQIARDNLTDIVTNGRKALKDVIDLASGTEHPRAYEVVGQLVTSLSSANKDLLAIHETKEKIKKTQLADDGTSSQTSKEHIINNNVFVGSTRELQEILSKRKLKVI